MALLYLIAFKLSIIFKTLEPEKLKTYCKFLSELPLYIKKCLSLNKQILKITENFYRKNFIFFIGRGLDYYISMEASLKLKELSYIHSEAYAAGELKHGPISLIEKGTPVFAIATQNKLLPKTLSNIKEVLARGADVVLLCKEDATLENKISNHIIKIPRMPDIFTPFCNIVPLQLFSYHAAVLRDCDVDKPRNLAKSVTVE